MDAQFEKIKKTHEELISSYYVVQGKVSKLPHFSRYNILILSRFIVTLFCESHFKIKYNELGNTYLQIGQTIPRERTSEYEWYLKVGNDLKETAKTFSTWKSLKGFITACWPNSGVTFAIPHRDVILQLFANPWSLSPGFNSYGLATNYIYYLFGLLLIGPLLLTLYFVIFISAGFQYKRCLFYSNPTDCGNFSQGPHNTNSNVNIYQIEDQLFELVGKSKSREFPFEIILFSLMYFVIVLVLTLFFYFVDPIQSITSTGIIEYLHNHQMAHKMFLIVHGTIYVGAMGALFFSYGRAVKEQLALREWR